MDCQQRTCTDLMPQDVSERQPWRDVVDVEEAVERAVRVDPVANAAPYEFAIAVMIRVADEDPNLVQMASKRVVSSAVGRELVEVMSEHSTELMGKVRDETSCRVNIRRAPAVPPQGLLYDSKGQAPTVHCHWEEPGRKPAPMGGFRKGAHVIGPLAIFNQGRLRKRQDGCKLRVVPVDWQGASVPGTGWLRSLTLIARSSPTLR